MNKIRTFLPFLCLLACLFSQCSVLHEEIKPTGELLIKENDCFPDVADKYVYPLKYKSEEWNELFAIPESIINAYQLPNDILKSMSTLGLIRSFIDIPLYTLNFWNPYRLETAHEIYLKINSVQELITRKDAAKSLIAYYAASKYDCWNSFSVCWDSYIDCIRLISGRDDFKELSIYCVQRVQDCCEYEQIEGRLYLLEHLFTTLQILGMLNEKDRVESVKLLLEKNSQYNKRHWCTYPCDNLRLNIMVWIMYNDMLPFFGEELLDRMKNGFHQQNHIYDILDFAESFIK